MAQLTIYIDEPTLKKFESAAKLEKCSISKWAKSKLTNTLESEWPEGFFNLLGCLKDSNLERPTQLKIQNDISREQL